MKSIELKGTVRKAVGKKDAKKARKASQVPCVIYGGKENVHFTTDEKELQKIIYTPDVYIVKFDIDGTIHQVIMQDLQFHAVSDRILHMDFLQVHDDKPITVKIPVQLEGFSKGVKAGGKLSLMNRALKVKGLAKHLPEILKVNVEELELGKSIKVGELHFENIELLDSKNSVVAAVKLTRAAKGMGPEEEGAATAEKAAEKAE